MSYFELFLHSANNSKGTASIAETTYNLGSVYDFAPTSYRYADMPYCYVKLKYFAIRVAMSAFNTATVGSVVVKLDSSLPNSGQSSNGAITQSNIIGLVPTSITKFTYQNNAYDNEWIKCPNIFKGTTSFRLEDQNGQLLSSAVTLSASTPYHMVLCVKFDDDPEYKNTFDQVSKEGALTGPYFN